MSFLFLIIKLIYFLLPAELANMAPPLVKPLLSKLALSPIDRGATLRGKRLFGAHKTWGGALFGIMAGMLGAYLQYLLQPYFQVISILDYADWALIGFLMGTGTILGDMIKSSAKRQIGMRPGQTWVPFDEIDFLIGTMLFISPYYFIGWLNIVLIMILGFLGHIAINLIGYYLKIRKRSEIINFRFRPFMEELFRKEGRLVSGTLFLLLSFCLWVTYGDIFIKPLLYVLLLIFLLLDFMRVEFQWHIPLFSRWGKVRFETDHFHPATFSMIGLILASKIVGLKMLFAAFSIFIYADTASDVMDKGFGRVNIFKKKTLEGSLVMFLAAMVVGAFYYDNLDFLFALAAIATLLELLVIRLPAAMLLPLSIGVLGNWLGKLWLK